MCSVLIVDRCRSGPNKCAGKNNFYSIFASAFDTSPGILSTTPKFGNWRLLSLCLGEQVKTSVLRLISLRSNHSIVLWERGLAIESAPWFAVCTHTLIYFVQLWKILIEIDYYGQIYLKDICIHCLKYPGNNVFEELSNLIFTNIFFTLNQYQSLTCFTHRTNAIQLHFLYKIMMSRVRSSPVLSDTQVHRYSAYNGFALQYHTMHWILLNMCQRTEPFKPKNSITWVLYGRTTDTDVVHTRTITNIEYRIY